MTPDEELMVIFGALHLVALLMGVLLFVLFVRSENQRPRYQPPDDDEGGGGGNDRLGDRPKTSPSGGIPLPDATPARMRLRGPGRLADGYRFERRRVAEPARTPRRVPLRR